ncbi:hypothetical protein ACIRRA_05755 [Nocardia sp. NPDC101769]|uniref:hypothetical protein n=1 Tax=Nocardia sp. NPDC101769 TaxID=3364333 RepID=UPI00382C715A
MTVFHLAVAVIMLTGAVALVWQLAPQGARGTRLPIIILMLISVSNVLLTPSCVVFIDHVCVNCAYLVSHLLALLATTLAALGWGDYLSRTRPTRRRTLVAVVAYGSAGLLLVVLFLTSPQQPDGIGFSREFAGSARIQCYWIVQAFLMMYAMSTLAKVAARARVRERHWRRGLLSVLLGVAALFAMYEIWVIVVVVCWPAMPPPWAQNLTSAFQVVATILLVIGATGSALSGACRSALLARAYIEELAPLHDWLTRRYPHVRFRLRRGWRSETRVTDMLIEISDALRLLQRDTPTLAADFGLDHESIRVGAHDRAQYAAYELTAARRFRSCYGTEGTRRFGVGRRRSARRVLDGSAPTML